MKYIVRQEDRTDREFGDSTQAVEYMISNTGYTKLFIIREGDALEELLMTKGVPPTHEGHDQRVFRSIVATC